ncbi:choice-of-anchor C family protein [Geminocystis herdmanii]|uniref:choice-of-anchor C family protein n=1 Tax=Geminocystis herdmanii TaxID=669359 RepID=UPI00034C9691|nr:choice-of-anchor C family protein [Geminocystis herdmanii]
MNNQFLFKMLEGQNIDNKYYLNKLLGSGGFGGVYLADEVVRDRLIRTVALKLIITDNPDKQLDELIFSTTLNHPNLISCFTCGECNLNGADFLYLLMEQADYSLEDELKKGKLSEENVKELVLDITNGLDYLHRQKPIIVHRDLKPGNILRVGDKWKISDFGLVRSLQGTASQTTTMMGSMGYAPPEAYEGKISPAWDIWSLGILIIEILTGKLPFDTNDSEHIRKLVINATIPIPPLTYPFNKIIRECLIKDSENRISAKKIIDILVKNQDQDKVTNINNKDKSNNYIPLINLNISIFSFLILIGLSLYFYNINNLDNTPKNLIKNGSFEEGVDINKDNKFNGLNTKSQGISNWEIIRDDIDYKENFWQNSDGNRSLDLNGGQAGAISQTFPTKIGERYLVKFDMGGNPDNLAIPIRKIIISVGEQQGHFVFDMRGGKTRENMQWQTFKWEFIAEDSMTTLIFSVSQGNTSAYGPTLDNVRVFTLK